MSEATASLTSEVISTGIAELDSILGGGLTAQRVYLLEGTPGSGKTTIALQFLLEGAAQGRARALHHPVGDRRRAARGGAQPSTGRSTGSSCSSWSARTGSTPTASSRSSIRPRSNWARPSQGVMECVDRIRPTRVVFDSLSEMRLLAQNSLRYRRQILALKQYFSTRDCTVLMLDDRSSDPGDLQLHSIAHGVITLEQAAQDYGSERRRLRVVKMRGVKYRGGYHDFVIETGGVAVFPRLVAAEHHTDVHGRTGIDRHAAARPDAGRRAVAPAPTPCSTGRRAWARPPPRSAAA